MAAQPTIVVIDKAGARGTVRGEFDAKVGAADAQVVVVDFSGTRYQVPREALLEQATGEYLLPLTVEELTLAQQVIPIVEETARVEKRVHANSVRVHKSVRERLEDIEVDLESQDVTVERVPMPFAQIVEGEVKTRTEGDTTIIPVVEERLIVTKELVLKEEIRITRKRKVETYRDTVSLREEHIEVERAPEEGGSNYVDPATNRTETD